ncbi:plasmid recombination protein [Clostridium estertheticum]|uniref:MobV family relaxase n=1 Tax=Clostridium estertheticum TaxID=238834 RepID=UPI001CF283E1|nr:MobV family relaxase [Clostridium estertheticum]MCB2309459.1 plasmid recombination protein [Clostridium estertheticum]MCB2347898.1 plasmid recombination protein [Clostridium estertheticum]MCB2352409.1 plasmid recombination protein [Clostridium estertheticum]WAG48577.1 plasmid recombination protein [Clostridium estertheticum]
MSYLICHVQKFKANDVKGTQIHNQRESVNSKNKDINEDRTILNYDLHNEKHINYNHKIKEIIKDGYSVNKGIRKDAVVMTSTLITSDNEYFKKLHHEDQEKFFKHTYEFLKDKYGEKNIVSAIVHLDETTPHMHLCSVPLTKDGRLSAKIIFNRKALLQLQSELPMYLQDKGFDIQRGEVGSKKTHLDTQTFKLKTKQEELEKNKIEFDKADNELKIKSKALESLTSNISNLEQTSVKKSFIGSKITLQEVDYNKIIKLAKKGVLNEKSLNDLKRVNLSLERDNLNYHQMSEEHWDKYDNLNRKYKKLNSNVKDLIKENEIMTNVLEKNNLIPEFKQDLKNEKEIERISRRKKRQDLEL